jgi:hypothetical protein
MPLLPVASRTVRKLARPGSLAALAFALLAVGYADLSRGGTTAAPVLLTIAYCGFVPLALARRRAPAGRTGAARTSARGSANLYRPGYGVAALTALSVLGLYAATLAPTTAMWDTSEYIAAAKVLGLPHPPGNPLFMLIAHSFSLLPLPLPYAARINLLAALASATAAGLWFLVSERVLATWIPFRWAGRAGAATATMLGATSFTVWNQSVVNEKVYTVSLMGIALISWLMVRWSDAPASSGADRLLVLVAYLLGLGYTNHPAGLLPLPAVALTVLARRAEVLPRGRVLATAAAAFVLGLTVFAYEPIRAAHFPPINEGEPTACVREFAWSCTFDPVTLERLRANLERRQYQKPSVLDRQAPFTAQMGMWWLYFKWQWMRDAYGEHPLLQEALALLALGLAVTGAVTHWRRHRESFWYLGTLVLTLTPALAFYLNFRYGWSQAPELGSSVPREVRDRDYFYLWSYSALGVWTGVGLTALWAALARLAPPGRARSRAGAGASGDWLRWTPVLAVALIPLVANARQASRRAETTTREWAIDLLNSVEPYAILITNGDNDTFPLWYVQEVEGVRRDVTVAVSSYLRIDWFARQLIRRPVHEYDAAKGPAIYRGRPWQKPSGPPLAMTFAEADAIPPVVDVREPLFFRHGKIVAQIPAGPLTRDQIVVLRLIKDAFPERPIYFTSGGYAASLGLGPYLVTQGLVQRLMPNPVTPGPTMLGYPGGYLDLSRTEALWTHVYRGPAALIREGGWVDRASLATPYSYAIVGELLAAGLERVGRTAEGARVAAAVGEIARAARLEGFSARGLPAEGAEGDRPR